MSMEHLSTSFPCIQITLSAFHEKLTVGTSIAGTHAKVRKYSITLSISLLDLQEQIRSRTGELVLRG